MSNVTKVAYRWFQFDKYFIENCNEYNNEGYFLEFDVQYPENLGTFHNDLTFLPEIINF